MFAFSPMRTSAGTSLKGYSFFFPCQGPRPIRLSCMRQVNLYCNISGFGPRFEVLASKRSKKKDINDKESYTNSPLNNDVNLKGFKDSSLGKSPTVLEDNDELNSEFIEKDLDGKSLLPIHSRNVVLQACAITSTFLLALGVALRKAAHIAFLEGWGWAKLDPTVDVSYNYFEVWHAELIIGVVILVSTSRYILLKMWKDFSDSSEAANQQVLGQLQPLDYVVVAFLPGISEEFFFRGALLPVFGLDWTTSLIIGAVFGCLHLGNGRRFSFAVWATVVGFVYGMATIWSRSAVVPMASHSLNNLAAGLLWRYYTRKQ